MTVKLAESANNGDKKMKSGSGTRSIEIVYCHPFYMVKCKNAEFGNLLSRILSIINAINVMTTPRPNIMF